MDHPIRSVIFLVNIQGIMSCEGFLAQTVLHEKFFQADGILTHTILVTTIFTLHEWLIFNGEI